MAGKKKEVRIGTESWETTVENEDIKAKAFNRELSDWSFRGTETLQFICKSDCIVEVNGYRSMVPANSPYNAQNEVFTFITIDGGIEYYLSMTF